MTEDRSPSLAEVAVRLVWRYATSTALPPARPRIYRGATIAFRAAMGVGGLILSAGISALVGFDAGAQHTGHSADHVVLADMAALAELGTLLLATGVALVVGVSLRRALHTDAPDLPQEAVAIVRDASLIMSAFVGLLVLAAGWTIGTFVASAVR